MSEAIISTEVTRIKINANSQSSRAFIKPTDKIKLGLFYYRGKILKFLNIT